MAPQRLGFLQYFLAGFMLSWLVLIWHFNKVALGKDSLHQMQLIILETHRIHQIDNESGYFLNNPDIIGSSGFPTIVTGILKSQTPTGLKVFSKMKN